MTSPPPLQITSTRELPPLFTGECILNLSERQEHRWYENGECHREDGPAIVLLDFFFAGHNDWLKKEGWYNRGNPHRVGGPAIIFLNNEEWFFIGAKQYSEEDYWNHPLNLQHKFNNVLNYDPS